MVVVSTVRRRGATIVTEANAEVLFTRNGPVGNFARVFSGRVRSFTSAAAPANSRPTWAHEPAARGKPLKRSFSASTKYVPELMRVFSAVGSTANYSAFVDQGTGIYNGGSPWEAKILPPVRVGSPSLYEHTWYPEVGSRTGRKPVTAVEILGQRPQFFFARGLDKAFKSMGIPTVTVPGTARLGSAVDSFPDELTNFLGAATPADAAFRASLAEWRSWRDKAWKSHKPLGRDGHNPNNERLNTRHAARRTTIEKNRAARRAQKPSVEQRRANDRARQQKFRDNVRKAKAKNNTTRSVRQNTNAQHSQASMRERIRFVAALTGRYPASRGYDVTGIRYDTGQHRWVAVVRSPNGTTKPVQGREVR